MITLAFSPFTAMVVFMHGLIVLNVFCFGRAKIVNMEVQTPSLERPRSSNLTSTGLGQWHFNMLPCELLQHQDGLATEVLSQLPQAFPLLLQLVNDVADAIFVQDMEHFHVLVADVLHSVVNPVADVTTFNIPDVTAEYIDRLGRLSDAVSAMFTGSEAGPFFLTPLGRALVRYSKFRPVRTVEKRKVKIFEADVTKVSMSMT